MPQYETEKNYGGQAYPSYMLGMCLFVSGQQVLKAAGLWLCIRALASARIPRPYRYIYILLLLWLISSRQSSTPLRGFLQTNSFTNNQFYKRTNRWPANRGWGWGETHCTVWWSQQLPSGYSSKELWGRILCLLAATYPSSYIRLQRWLVY